MQIALQTFLFAGGLVVAIAASNRPVEYTRALAVALAAPAFIVGVSLVSIGTDLPEIANSIASHLEGEGDINVGTRPLQAGIVLFSLAIVGFGARVAVRALIRLAMLLRVSQSVVEKANADRGRNACMQAFP